LGLPYLRGALLAKARELQAPVLVSANSFSRWNEVPWGREWAGFKQPPAALIAEMPVYLDSGGFVAAVKYRGWPWAVDSYLNLCAAAPWRWFASMDWCVEPEIARDEATVMDRISGTVRLNILCRLGAAERGIQDRLMPVIQGWEPDHYLRCMDRLSGFLDGVPLVGLGSMCRRHVEGPHGVLQVVDALDRAAPPGMRFHLFGLKSQAVEELRGHPRIASVDSQAYGVRARRIAIEEKRSKTEAMVADVMADWYAEQLRRIDRRWLGTRSVNMTLALGSGSPRNGIESAIRAAEEQMRELHEAGELDWSSVGSGAALEWAFLDQDDEDRG
jgi:hypothetical protein